MNPAGSENGSFRVNTPIKILAVDDREDNLLSIETILEKEGFTVVKANSGRAALKLLLKEHDFSLILMDVQMPHMNGLETATLIYERDKLKHIPIIFITAYQYGEDLIFKGYKMGGVDYIHKPVDPALLRFKVGVFVELYRKTNELVQQEEKLKAINKSLEIEIMERRISEQRIHLLNEQLLENNSELKSTNEELDRFAFVASHDLQEPLRKILLFNDMISQKLGTTVDASITDYLQRSVKATGRMQMLINDLLKYSRNTHTDEDFIRTNLNDLLNDVLSDLEMEIKRVEAEITVKPLPALAVLPTQIRQLFQNLISNSIKFSRKDERPHIEVFCDEILSNPASGFKNGSSGSIHRISVRDNGIGFDEKYKEEIFVVFKRLHSYHNIEGTGIGLSICKKIVERHNGTLTAQSSPGKGSTFIVSLPDLDPQ
jgi:hypothetical protein